MSKTTMQKSAPSALFGGGFVILITVPYSVNDSEVQERSRNMKIRVKVQFFYHGLLQILEQLSRTRFFTGFENPST